MGRFALSAAPASQARKIGAIKSLLNFGERIGYLAFNVGAMIRVPPVKNILAERILEENDVITPERFLEAYHLQRTRFELVVERKLRKPAAG